MLHYLTPRVSLVAVLLAALLSGGCAANSTTAGEAEDDTRIENSVDPWEHMNRPVFRFNRKLDSMTLEPVATAYVRFVPSLIRTGFGNFLKNLRGPRNIINNFLQGKGGNGFSETGRFVVNSTVGLGGLFDVASRIGLDRHREDFGQTLAVWGVPDGPFVMVPFGGPQTLRDAFAFPLDVFMDPLWHYEHGAVRYAIYALRFTDFRAGFLDTDDLLDEAFDPYVRLREAYLQNRRFEVYDGNPPVDDDFYDDVYDDLPEPDPAPEDDQQ
jgi:phospholipid-binding lipoprotein MlaA